MLKDGDGEEHSDNSDEEEDSDPDEEDLKKSKKKSSKKIKSKDKKNKKEHKAKESALSLTRAVLCSKAMFEDKKKKRSLRGKIKIKNGYVQEGYTLADLRNGNKDRKEREAKVWRVVEGGVSG